MTADPVQADPRRLAGALPDEPRWIEVHGLARRGRARWLGARVPGFVARDDELRLLVVVGRPRREIVAEAVAGVAGGWELVVQMVDAAAASAALPGWRAEEAILHTLPPEVTPPVPPVAELRDLGTGDEELLGHVPEPSRSEIACRLGEVDVVAAFDAGRPVAFCLCHLESGAWWDVAIETLEGYRRRGLASACAARLIRRLRRRGREPVWGSLRGNRASRALAASLGFRPAARIAVLASPG